MRYVTGMSSTPEAGHAAYIALRARLTGPLRDVPLSGEQLCEVARVIYGHPDGFSLYGLTAPALAAAGVRLLGRMPIQCCVDAFSVPVAEAVAALLPAGQKPLIADLFCGSGNFSLPLSRLLDLPACAAELDPLVHEITRANLGLVGAATRLHLADFRDLLHDLPARSSWDVYFVEPPWGPAASAPDGLDLTRTSPPVPEILDAVRRSRDGRPCLVVIKTKDRIARDSLATSFAGARHLRTIARPPTLPYGSNRRFHIYRLDE